MVSAFSTASQTISVNCTKGSAYPVRLGDGARPVSVGAARRASSSAEFFPGNGLGNGSQIFNYNAKICTDQTTPPAGTYTDNVVLDVGF